QAAIEGKTGIDAFDAWAHELVETGYLHNHARMWFASIWIFTLELPWQLGADFFYRHLLDGDAASNTCSWRWVAGLHTRGKNYVARASNIEKYTLGRFNPRGQLAENPAPLDGEENPPRSMIPMTDPLPSDEPALLVLHEDDLGLEALPWKRWKLCGVALLDRLEARSPETIGAQVRDFVTGALADTHQRVKAQTGYAASVITNYAALIDHAKACGARQIIAPYAPVGPVRDELTTHARAFNDAQMPVRHYRHAYDDQIWPHATAGFFKVKKQIPQLLKTFGGDRGRQQLEMPGL
ncbi:MAG: FAD-binding domain-containing protein, partial [Pseudomonadota bacterium]